MEEKSRVFFKESSTKPENIISPASSRVAGGGVATQSLGLLPHPAQDRRQSHDKMLKYLKCS